MIFNSIEEAMLSIAKDIEEAKDLTAKEAGKFARDAALSTTKFRMGSGFKEATQFHSTGSGTGFVSTDRDYAYWLEEGNNQKGPFIYPVKAKALHWKANGVDIFRKKVRSHGPYHYMAEAGDKLASAIPDIFIQSLLKSLKE